MKKVAIISLVALMAVGFAFEPKFDGTLSSGIMGGDNQSMTNWKSRLNLSGKISDVSSIYYQLDVAGTATNKALLYVDTKALGLSFRVGTQIFGPANLYAGLYQDAPFYTVLKIATDPGIQVMTNVAGYDVSAIVAGGFGLNAQQLGLKVGTTVSGVKVSAYGTQVGSSSKLICELQTSLFGADVYAQGSGAIMAAGGSTYVLPGVIGFVNGTVATDGTDIDPNANNQQLYTIGLGLPVNADVLLGAGAIFGNNSNSSMFGVQLKI